MNEQFGPCPVCDGTGRVPPAEKMRKWANPNADFTIAGYDKATDTLPCSNCGGQTMSGRGIGQVLLRADGTPCKHEYDSWKAGNCYFKYRCIHCGDTYAIDSGD